MNTWFAVLAIAGLMLVGAEVFVPGGVLGIAGGLALLTAAIIGFSIFSPEIATLIAVGMIAMVGVVIALWIRIFPRTGIGRQMTVLLDFKGACGTDASLAALVGKTGMTRSSLRPAGFVEVDNRRVDVVTEGGMIDRDVPVRIIGVKGNHLVVEAMEAETHASSEHPAGSSEGA